MQTKGSISSMFQITLLQEQVVVQTHELQGEVEKLLTEFEDVFLEPKSLPPHRTLDHEIRLLPNSVLVNVRPYRDPRFQKGEIEKQVAEMLK